MADGLLQDSYGLAVGRGDEGDDHAVGSGAAGSPGPVHVVLRRRGQIEMDDAADVVDVDPPRPADVGGDERLGLSGNEGPQCPVARWAWDRPPCSGTALTPAATSWRATRSVPYLVRQNTTVGPCEATRLAASATVLAPGVHPMMRRRRRLLFDLDRHLDRCPLVPPDELVDVAVEGGREQQGLAVGPDLVEDRLHLRQEAHVGHAVRFVDDDDRHVGQPDRSRAIRSRSRPGQATAMSTPRRNAVSWPPKPTPP